MSTATTVRRLLRPATFTLGKPDSDHERLQIINGKEIVMPSPKIWHQQILTNLLLLLRSHVKRNSSGTVLPAPWDVVLQEKTNVLQPDIVFVSKQNDIIRDGIVRGVPDLVVEVTSANAVKENEKFEVYQRFGVPEYWAVVPLVNAVKVYNLVGGKYKSTSAAIDTGSVKSQVLSGFSADLEHIFEGFDAYR